MNIRNHAFRPSFALALLVLSFFSVSCSQRPTQLVIRISSDMAPLSELATYEIHVERHPRNVGEPIIHDVVYDLHAATNTLPAELGIISADGNDDRRVEVTVTAHVASAGATDFTVRAIVSFLPQKSALLDIFLAKECHNSGVAMRCDSMNETCGAGGMCIPVERITLPELDRSADASAPHDVPVIDARTDSSTDVEADTLTCPTNTVICQSGGTSVCADLTSDTQNCASCGHVCAPPANGVATCTAMVCGIQCNRDFAASGGQCVPVPHMISPASTSIVTRTAPTFTWQLGANTDGAQIDICTDRTCAVAMTDMATGSTYTLSSDTPLPPGVHYWRLRSMLGATVTSPSSPVWEFVVPAWSTSTDGSYGTIPDFNGDGLADIAIGAPGANGGHGAVYIFNGNNSSISLTPSTTLTGGTTSVAAFGSSVASAGDFNGDGFGDLIVGLPLQSASDGEADVFFGSPTGLSTTVGFVIAGPLAGAGQFGSAVSSAGDTDHDGFTDVLVGAPAFNAGAGSAQLIYGLGTRTNPAWLGPDGASSHFGSALSGGSDLTADGFADIAIGDFGARDIEMVANSGNFSIFVSNAGAFGTAPTSRSTQTIVQGSEEGRAINTQLDYNADGLADVLIGDPGIQSGTGEIQVADGMRGGLSGEVHFIPSPSASDGGRFGTSVAGVPSDGAVQGIGDLIVVGAPLGAGGSGFAYIYIGANLTPVTSIIGPGTDTVGFGTVVANAGDVNGDGHADLLVTAPTSGSNAGRAFIFFGQSGKSPFNVTPDLTFESPIAGSALFGSAAQ